MSSLTAPQRGGPRARSAGASKTGAKSSAGTGRSRARASARTPGKDSSGGQPIVHFGKLESPLTTYYLLLGVTATLVVFGLIMVFSASSVESLLADEASYTVFAKQLLFAVVGAGVAAWAARWPIRWWRRIAWAALVGAVLLQAAVFIPGLGVTSGGNRNWLALGPVQVQPSEFAKLALVLTGATIFANKGSLAGNWLHAVLPYVLPISAVVLSLTLAGQDLGTGLVMGLIVTGVLFVAGAPKRLFVAGGLAVVAGIGYLVATSSNRMNRISNWLDPECQSDPDSWCGQSVHGMYALADGGWWGVGLGGSKEKWKWLSEAHNDFIFAIIGEELGLPGTFLVLVLFGLLAWGCYRLVTRTQDRFVRIASAGVMVWLIGQATINIGSVIGLFPVVGVPLPLVSAGGSSLVTTLLALGMLLAFARNEPGCRALLAARPSVVRRTLSVLPSRLPARPARLRSR
ncbi:putative lipid II flippase FtsW [Intrasporangium calvum]|uniref:Probable peptidoglycan glycosyltransferase FtsW n=1 Tax=Intrasporangium calvum TaxID=53358 RepID=A0ABT5GIA6_9MICO|nr:putative lipid II flippase FtsW [Intrasporangium calvum]MDC5697862.1 putative lipid II flippase FtsW [Intrasporangium calvum]